jgi:beta-galactosidase
LQKIDEICGTKVEARVAVIFSWDNMWALDNCQGYANAGKKYYETCYAYHRFFWEMGIDCDVVSPKADLSGYKIVVAPMLYLTDRPIIDNLRDFVAAGGTLYATYMLGTVNETDLCWLGGIPAEELKEVFGITAQEIDTLYPGEIQKVTLCGQVHEVCDYCEALQLRGAEALATYADGWMAGMPAVTVNSYGKGRAFYQACRDTGSLKKEVLSAIVEQAGVGGNVLLHPYGVTAHSRTDGEHTYVFVENYLEQEAQVSLRTPMENMLTGKTEQQITLPPYGFGVYKR